MKYWAYLFAKLLVATGMIVGLWALIRAHVPRQSDDVTDLWPAMIYSICAYGLWLFGAGLMYLIAHDQRYRCRTCLHKLCMPIARGSWDRMLQFGRPHMEYICPYGHGTLKVPELQITGKEPIAWDENQDMWKELELLDTERR